VTDPLGQKVQYKYDAKGDLVGVIDREGNETKFEYDGVRSHYLNKIVDPLGREAVKTEYDEQGRLKKSLNAAGNGVELVHDPANSVETVKDALGNATTYEYDQQGNIVTEVDAVGKITKRTYDEDNNTLTETEISDRSGPSGFTTTYTYDSQRNKLSETDALGNTTYYTYGDRSRLLSTTDPLGRTTVNNYDGRGNLTATKDAMGNINSFIYDGSGQLTQSTDAQNNITKFQYNIRGNITQILDPVGHSTNYTYNNRGDRLTETKQVTTASGSKTSTAQWAYDNSGKMLSAMDALGNTTTYEYDKLSMQTAVTDALGRKTRYVYNDRGELIETIYADETLDDLTDNPRTRTEYDAMGREVIVVDRAGRVSRTVYDAVGRVVELIAPDDTPNDLTDDPRIKTEYFSDGVIKVSIDERGNRTEYRYDVLGRQVEMIYADATPNDLSDNPRSQYEYNQAGQRISVTDVLNRKTKFFYDDLSRLIKTIYADDTFITNTYDDLGRRIGVADQNGKVTEYRYDTGSRLNGVKNALGDWTNYEYSTEGSLLKITDANGNSTSYEYDLLGRRVATILPLGQRSSTSYDVVGNMKTATDFNGNTTIYKYDVENRLIEQRFTNDPTFQMTYTIDSQVATVTDGRGVTSFSYDAQNRLRSRIDVDGSQISYTYDLAGNCTSVTTKVLNSTSNTTAYSFDERNRLDKVTQGSTTLADYDYDGVGNLVQTTLANGVIENRQYDQLNHLLRLQSSKGNDILTNFLYRLDKTGNRQQLVETLDGTSRTVRYTYDGLYRLTKENVIDALNGNRATEFIYDKVGNRQQQQTLTANATVQTTTYQYDANDRLLKEQVNGIDKVIYTYDSNGNTLTKTENGKTIESLWNDQDRLVGSKVRNASGVTSQQANYEYDASGIRVSRSAGGEVTKYLIDANLPYAQVLVEYRPSGLVLVSYVHGNDLIEQVRDGVSSFYHVDALGSTRLLSDAVGRAIDTYSYQAFGELLDSRGGSQNNYLFAGEQFDPVLQDYYNRARYYDPATGRFTKRDDFEGQLPNPTTLHKYFYANENPINFIDPSGLTSMSEISAANSIFNNLMAASNVVSKILNAVDKANAVVEGINLVAGVLSMFTDGGIQPYLEGFLLGAATNPKFDVKDAINSFAVQAPNVVRLAFPYWLPWLVQYNEKVSEILIFLGNPGWLPPLASFKTGRKLGKLPLNIAMLGKSNTGSLVGAGFMAKGVPPTGNEHQVWRMDYHNLHPKSIKDIHLIPDGKFHYHILDPYRKKA
jgi:RHS repeat-associated protein